MNKKLLIPGMIMGLAAGSVFSANAAPGIGTELAEITSLEVAASASHRCHQQQQQQQQVQQVVGCRQAGVLLAPVTDDGFSV